MTFTAITGTLGGLGLGSFWLRVFGVEGASAQRWVSPSLKLALMATAASLFAALVIPQFLFSSSLAGLLAIGLLPLAAAQILTDLLQSKFQLEEKYVQVSFLQMLPNLSKAIAAFTVFEMALDAWSAAVLMSGCAAFLAAAVTRLHAPSRLFLIELPAYRNSPAVTPGAPPALSTVLSGTLPFALATVSYPIYFQGGLLTLGFVGSSHDAGLFGAAFLVLTAAYLLPAVTFQKFLVSRMQWWAAHKPAIFMSVVKYSALLLTVTGLALLLLINRTAEFLVSILFGPPFAETAGLLTLLAVAIPFRYYSVAIGSALLTGRSVLARSLCEVCAATLTASITAFGYTNFGPRSAVVATIASEIFLAAAYSFLFYRAYGRKA
jgi:O-antigen/teichoic acid export membrane protein